MGISEGVGPLPPRRYRLPPGRLCRDLSAKTAPPSLPNTLNLALPGLADRRLLESAPGLAAATGSACYAGQHSASSVLGAMGQDTGRAARAVRLSLGRFTTPQEIERAAIALIGACRELAA